LWQVRGEAGNAVGVAVEHHGTTKELGDVKAVSDSGWRRLSATGGCYYWWGIHGGRGTRRTASSFGRHLAAACRSQTACIGIAWRRAGATSVV
jgi:hypothetical protein